MTRGTIPGSSLPVVDRHGSLAGAAPLRCRTSVSRSPRRSAEASVRDRLFPRGQRDDHLADQISRTGSGCVPAERNRDVDRQCEVLDGFPTAVQEAAHTDSGHRREHVVTIGACACPTSVTRSRLLRMRARLRTGPTSRLRLVRDLVPRRGSSRNAGTRRKRARQWRLSPSRSGPASATVWGVNSGAGPVVALGVPSGIEPRQATPAMPSATTWWSLMNKPMRASGRPGQQVPNVHNGRDRSRRWAQPPRGWLGTTGPERSSADRPTCRPKTRDRLLFADDQGKLTLLPQISALRHQFRPLRVIEPALKWEWGDGPW
jgi:hypothetical protein